MYACFACSDGCGRTGSFIAIYYTLERVKAEQTVDIFQAIKNSRIRRTSLVSNVVSNTVSVPSHFLNFYTWYKLYYNNQTLSCYCYRSNISIVIKLCWSFLMSFRHIQILCETIYIYHIKMFYSIFVYSLYI